MKKLFTMVFCIGMGTSVYGAEGLIYRSSFTQTNETKTIAASNVVTNGSTVTVNAGYLAAVVVTSASVPTGLLKLYNSTFTTNNQFANITLGTVGYYDFKDSQLQGLTYTTSNNNSGVTIIYRKN